MNEVNIKRQNKLKKISRKEIRAEINNKKINKVKNRQTSRIQGNKKGDRNRRPNKLLVM